MSIGKVLGMMGEFVGVDLCIAAEMLHVFVLFCFVFNIFVYKEQHVLTYKIFISFA